jgi:hypothetical protein
LRWQLAHDAKLKEQRAFDLRWFSSVARSVAIRFFHQLFPSLPIIHVSLRIRTDQALTHREPDRTNEFSAVSGCTCPLRNSADDTRGP